MAAAAARGPFLFGSEPENPSSLLSIRPFPLREAFKEIRKKYLIKDGKKGAHLLLLLSVECASSMLTPPGQHCLLSGTVPGFQCSSASSEPCLLRPVHENSCWR